MPNKPVVHIWCPSIDRGKGGVESFSFELVRAAINANIYRVTIFVKGAIPSDILKIINPSNHPGCIIVQRVPNGQWKLISNIKFGFQVLVSAIIQRPSIIISTHIHLARLAVFLDYFFGIPYASVLHGIDVWGNRDKWIRQTMERASLLLPVSNYTRIRVIEENNLPPSRLHLFPNTYDDHIYLPTAKSPDLMAKYGLSSGDKILLTVCRLQGPERAKGYDQVIKILPELARLFPNIRYMIVGRGPDTDRIQKMADLNGVGDRLILTGFVPTHILPAYYNLCDIFIMPSKKEGFGIVFLEAMGCGKPVIAGNVDGSVDPLMSGALGKIVDPDDLEAIANAIKEIMYRSPKEHVMFDPEELSARTKQAFGKHAFKNRLIQILTPYMKNA